MAETPETMFTQLGEDRIAYQVIGAGPLDLLYVGYGLANSVDVQWDCPPAANFLGRLASFCRVIMFDRRGVGASDPVSSAALPTMEEWADDAKAVLDAVGSERAAIFGATDAGPPAILFAASQPERTRALILANTSARVRSGDDYASGFAEAELEDVAKMVAEMWGTEALADFACPDAATDVNFRRWFTKMQRAACSPRESAGFQLAMLHADVRGVLGSVAVPTLILHRENAAWLTIDQGRYLAEHIPGARFEAIPGADMTVFTEPSAPILDHIEAFLTGMRPAAQPNRVLAAVLFTDIVASTRQAAALGDSRWRTLMESHNALTRAVVDQHNGRLVKTTGDGLVATFDGPGRAIRCAFALTEAVRPLGVEIRAGLHTGEIEVIGDDIAGIAVHLAARVMAEAGPGEVLVSSAVPPLVAGSSIEFADRGEHELKGIPGTWRLFLVGG